jgi:hypothetical protein
MDNIAYFLFTAPSSLSFLFNRLQDWVHMSLEGFFLLINNLFALEEPSRTG